MSNLARTLIAARVGALTGLPLVPENTEARPAAGTTWLSLTLAPERAAGGLRWVGEGGTARLDLRVPLGEGAEAAESLGQTLSDGLSARRLSDATTALICGPALTEPARAEGAFWRLPLAVPYHLIRGR